MREKRNRIIKDIGEFELINWIRKRAIKSNDTLTGIGDDVAEVCLPEGKNLIVTTDCIQEGVHFKSGFAPPEFIGKKLIRVNLSDIAASGGRARWCVLTVGLNRALPVEWFRRLMQGFMDEIRKYNVSLVGGDIVESLHENYFSLTLFGTVGAHLLRLRSGANPKDRIFVTGTLGDSALGLKLLKDYGGLNKLPAKFKWLAKRHLLPEPRLYEGAVLAEEGIASAMIDVSDGLFLDLWHVLDESECGCIIYGDKIPLSTPYRLYCANSGDNLLSMIFSGGEDYELLFTVPEKKISELLKVKTKLKSQITEIGVITEKKSERFIDINGKRNKLKPAGFKHFQN